MTTTPPAPDESTAGSPDSGSGGPRRPALKTQGQKLAEALGFGGAPAGEPIMPPVVPPREPKKAFPSVPPPAAPAASVPASPASPGPLHIPLSALDAAFASALPDHQVKPVATSAMVHIEGGTFLYGETKKQEKVPSFEIDRDPVTNREYGLFLRAAGHRPPLYWKDGVCPPDLLDHPVVGVDYYDATAYAKWSGKDLPYEDEWERAARGTDGRTYPWGEDPDASANTARTGLKMTLPVGFHARNVSPDGCRDMVGNAWELTHSPAPGGGVVVRGGSWYDFALYSKTFFRFASRAEARNGTIGFRCVKRAAARTDVARSVPETDLERAIATRRGKGEPVDFATWSPERRDLVPDLRRLKQVIALHEEELAAAASPAKPAIKKAFGAPAPQAPVSAPSPRPAQTAPLNPLATVAAPKPTIPAPTSPAPAPVVAKPAAPRPPAPPAPVPVVAKPAAPLPPAPPVPPVPAPVVAKPAAPRPPAPIAPPPPAPVVAKPATPAPAPVAPVVPKAPTPAAPAPIVAKPPAPAPVAAKPTPPPERRPQTGPIAPGAVTAAGEAAARDEASKERRRTEAEGAAAAEQPAPLRLALLVMAFLAASVLVVVAILHATHGSGPTSPASIEETARQYGIGPPQASDADGDSQVLLEGDATGALPTAIRTGSALLIFARPGAAGASESMATAVDLHRRLRGRALRVALVVPRDAVIKADRVGQLEGVTGDVTVLLDAENALRKVTWKVGEEPTAILLENGAEMLRVSSPERTSPLLLSHLAPLVQEALHRHPLAPKPADGATEPDETDK